MKMNPIKFAELIGYIAVKTNSVMGDYNIQQIRNLIDEGISPQALPTDISRKVVGDNLFDVQNHIKAGRKIEAIKTLRDIADMSLKEAKDWVEGWPTKKV